MRRKRKNDRPGRDIPELVIAPLPQTTRRYIMRAGEKNAADADTPDGIMLNALYEAYGVDVRDRKAYRRFIASFMRNLSLLFTSGKNEGLFEPDLDQFMTMVVRSINGCGEMMDLLERNGIEYRPKWLDKGNDEDSEE